MEYLASAATTYLMKVLRRAHGKALLLIVAAVTAVAVGAKLAYAGSTATPVGTGVVVIETNLAYEDGAAAGTGMVLTSSGKS